jgi:hypothetical protein
MHRLSFATILAIVLFALPAQAADFTVTPLCCATWIINGQSSPPLSLVRGKTYAFDVNAPDHPFFIKTAPVNGNGSTWDEGVTNNGLETGTLSFTVPADAPSTLFYQCGIHSAMTGTIQVTSLSVPATGAYATALLAMALYSAGLLVLRRARTGESSVTIKGKPRT